MFLDSAAGKPGLTTLSRPFICAILPNSIVNFSSFMLEGGVLESAALHVLLVFFGQGIHEATSRAWRH